MNNITWDAIWINATLATMKNGTSYGFTPADALAVHEGKIVWIGSLSTLPDAPIRLAKKIHDAAGRCITPGLIDCHTHLVYAGNRYHEFVMRLEGKSYADIAKAGGGIRFTVAATRAASFEELFQQSVKRAQALLADGVTTIEIKSGYGLDLPTELKILRVAKRIEEELSITVKKTFLGAHALPLEFQGHSDRYIDLICQEMIPLIAQEKLADAVDVFCETIGFTLQQTEKVFQTAKEWGLPVKCHAEQLSDSGSAALSAKYGALSVDHLEFLSEAGVKALAESGTVAVLLPGAFYFLRETHLPPIDLLRHYHVPIAIATDCNPGTSPVLSLSWMLNMACTLFKLTPEEALLGTTRHAATALGLASSCGTLEPGKAADFVVWDVSHPAELAYSIGSRACRKVIKNGKILIDNDNNH